MNNGSIALSFISSEDNIADVFTESVGSVELNRYVGIGGGFPYPLPPVIFSSLSHETTD